MVNSTTSGCRNCMILLRILVLEGLLKNRKVEVIYVKLSENTRADALSRLDFDTFFSESPESAKRNPCPLPAMIWPPSKIWLH